MSNYIHPKAVIMPNVELGTGNVICAGAVIGNFGAIRGSKLKDYNGKVVIGNNNYIGANCVVNIGEDGITLIGSNNIIMNLTNIAHNVSIGSNNEIGAGCLILGYACIGDNNKIKARVNLRNRKCITNNIIVGMGANVVNDLTIEGTYYGNPAKLK